MLGEQAPVAACVARRRLPPCRAAPVELLIAHLHAQAPSGDVELDDVAVAHQSERTADKGFRRDMQDAGAVARAAHARVGDANHVADALGQHLFRDRQLTPFRHARRSDRPGVLKHQDRILVDVEIRIVDAGGHVVIILEDDRLSRVLVQAGFGRGRFDDRPVGSKVAAQHGEAVGRDQRIVQGPNDVFVVDRRPARHCRRSSPRSPCVRRSSACLQSPIA